METKQPLTINLLRLSADKKQLLLLITPVQDEVSVQSLTRLFQTSDHTNLKLNLKGLNEAVQNFTRLETQKERSSELESIAIADRLHAQLCISFDPLKMVAKAVVTSAYGGLPITMEQLKSEMIELEITQGIINKTLLLLIEKSKNASPGSSLKAIIAKGTQPIHGTDTTFKRLVETPKERLLKPKKNENGTVDMRDLGQLITVKTDAPLMRKIPFIEGFDGITVTGEVIPHTSGKDFTFEVGKNTKISEQDENLLVATLSGIPKVFNNGMKVDDVLVVNNVDVASGHVVYEGSIIIEGDVCDAMQVKATGDITISGFVESALIECGGDLIIGKGILGRKVETGSENYSCKVKSEGSVSANFSQYSRIEAGLEVNIKKQLLHCSVSCKGDINVMDDSGMKGTILGGSLCTMGGVNTISMGANAGSQTVIDLVGNYPALMENKKQINDTIQTENDKLQSLIDAQQKIDVLPDSEKKQIIDARLMITTEEVKKHLTELNTNLNDNKSDLQSYFEHAQVITQKEMFNDVDISIGRDKFRSTRKYGPTKVSIQEYKIVAEPYIK